MKISIVIPALNEEAGIGNAIRQIPAAELARMGHSLEIIVVDNGSTDDTARIARAAGAQVIEQPLRGYGNAYCAGFAAATGKIIITGDADMTYPFDSLCEIIAFMETGGFDFVNTDRLQNLDPKAMSAKHVFGNRVLSLAARVLFGWPYRDSQSGMWIFKRSILPKLDLRSGGMSFSQELKIEAHIKGFKCGEVPIKYRTRAGKEKLNDYRDGGQNLFYLIKKRFFSPRANAIISAEKLRRPR